MLVPYFVLLLVIVAVSTSPCQEEREKALEEKKNNDGVYIPQCDWEGYYAPKQCNGSMCSCVDNLGNSLTASFHVDLSNCDCFREREDLKAKQIVGITLNCDENGNYGSRQCIDDVCFCVDPRTKQPLSEAVPIADQNQLDC